MIPVNYNKRPFIKWEPYQKRKATPEEVRGWWGRWPNANIGIVTGSLSGIVVIDVDDPDKGMQGLSEYLTTCKVPTATTPGGGYHLYFKAPEKCPSNSTGTLPGVDFRGEGGYIIAPPSQNGTGQAYAWPEGLSLDDIEPPPMPERLYNVLTNSYAVKEYKEHFEEEHTRARKSTEEHVYFEYGRRDDDLFHIANTMTKGGAELSIISEVLKRLILSWGEEVDEKWVNEKIGSALKRAERRERNIAQDLRKWVMSTEGHVVSTEYHAEARLSTREDKHAVTECLRRMAAEGILEKYGDKRGVYRKVDKDLEVIDFVNASDEIFPIKWPFGIERYVEICPKNVIVVAGEKDAGKSAFLLNVAQMNMDAHRIFYFSSEMGDREIKKRLSKFGIPLKQWTFTVIERSSNFSDVIQPDDVNIIDFLEIYDEFYKIGSFIKEIYTKLKKGIAIIAIQKNPKVEWGLGGMRSMEKARLYLSMEKGRVKIVSGKNWASQVRPDGLALDFKLVQGARFITERDWYRT